MNTIGKIFVFALFIMSLVFMSFAVALYSTHTNWRDEIMRTREQIKAGQQLGYKAQLDQAKTDRNNLSAEITKLQAEVAASEAARDQVVAKIQTALEEKNKDLEVLRKEKEARELEREKAQAELAAARLELEAASKVVADLRAEVRTQQDKVDEQVDRAAKIASELHEKESFLEIASERKAQLEKQVANARLLLQQSGLSIDNLPRDAVPKIDGVVTNVIDDSIELSLGGDDGLQMGHELDVYRNDQYLGRVRVVSIKPDKAVAVVIREFVRGVIQRGDKVATRLRA
jgi:seryl-tRNA synthetase